MEQLENGITCRVGLTIWVSALFHVGRRWWTERNKGLQITGEEFQSTSCFKMMLWKMLSNTISAEPLSVEQYKAYQ